MCVERIRRHLWFLVLLGFLGGCVPLRPYHTVCASGPADYRALLPDPVKKQCSHPTLLTRCDTLGDCSQVAGAHRMIAPGHMPILNIRTTGEVMTGHTDIWNPTMQGFLVQLLLSIVEQRSSAADKVALAQGSSHHLCRSP